MCRWFAYISKAEEVCLEDVLIKPPRSISKQLEKDHLFHVLPFDPSQGPIGTLNHEKDKHLRNKLYNADGLGVAWYDTMQERFRPQDGARRPTLYRIVRQPMTDPNFISICNNTASTAIFAHIRNAPHLSPVTAWNAHPFDFGRFTFMHNGDIAFFDRIKLSMCHEMSRDAYNLIKGNTDSEHLGALMFTILEKRHPSADGLRAWERSHTVQDLRAALEEAITKVIVLQVGVSTLETFEASTFNIAVTDGHRLLVTRFRNHPKEHPPVLYTSQKAGPDLNRNFITDARPVTSVDKPAKLAAQHAPYLMVSTERTTANEDDWELLPRNMGIMVDEDMNVEHFEINVQ